MIDIVLLWVDGNDPVWQAEYAKYAPCVKGDKREVRFRDWNNLRFLVSGYREICAVGWESSFCDMWACPGMVELRSTQATFCQTCGFHSGGISSYIQL